MNEVENRSLELCQRVVTTESFIAEARELYGDRYDYGKVDYKNREYRVTVICPVHGEFHVYAREHLDGKGCPKCAKGEKFLIKLKEKFGDKFGLGEFVYDSSTSPVTLICPTHGSFSRLPNQILNAPFGCPKCGNDALIQRREQARQDALEHKEERDQARRERARARREEARQKEEEVLHQEEILAKENWNTKINVILGQDTSQINLFEEYHPWYEDFFGLNMKALRLEDGTLVDGKQHLFLRPKHWPLRELKVEACQGELLNATFYLGSLEREKLYELLIILEDIIGHGFNSTMEDFIEAVEPINQKFSYDGIADGYKIVLHQRTLDVDIKIRKLQSVSSKRTKSILANEIPHPDITKKQVKSDSILPSSFVGIDFETLYPQRVSACSIGMVKYKDGAIVDRYYSLIRPPFDYPGKNGPELTWIHGLTKEQVEGSPTFEELLPDIERFVDGLPLVAHNACVERACIRDACAFYGIATKLAYDNIYDTLHLSRVAEMRLGIIEIGQGTHSLDAVCRRFNIPVLNHHNALADAEMCGNLMVVFDKVLNGSESVETKEQTAHKKYNVEDKVQREDMDNIVDNPFKNQVVVLTGFAIADSQNYAHQLNRLGAIPRDAISKKTNYLITGPNPGPSKMKKAEEVGITILSEEEFKSILEKYEQ